MADSRPIAQQRMETYLDAVEREDYETVAEQFTDDAVYHHPLLDGSIVGADEIARFLEEDRGPKKGSNEVTHDFEDWVIDGDTFAGFAQMTSPRGNTKLLVYGRIEDGKIAYYCPGLSNDIWSEG